ncbi:maltogenic amylase-like enzyme [Tenacibaculum adriaticum]|uniref:Maltogenic amylase-like enzyme n=1 Tax=Tenacibaculum adriaticum TaxID=413713 RepID=A0A5S5DW79_9FLAO|nr:alpha-amylase family glycosyl hydrolase [Tenacibaculum adriaticum]TYP99032.1 maltogenic amylase-like enzyme [Tenacibaculum adriaticum]
MRRILSLIALSTLVFACKTEQKETKTEEVKVIAPVSAAMMENAVIYEANIRQYSKEGTFDAFTKDIPQLKDLGVKIIWLMPVFPISETKRKATGGDFASKIEDPEVSNRMLGSYYAVSDFTKINPEFGTIEEFRELVKTAHDNDIYVILDWVPNHTGWDHTWLKTNPEFYTKNDKGEITDPLNEDGTPVGWADVADLNYNSKGLRTQMVKDMSYWITKEGVDGFRCDVAGSVPTDFWQEAIPQLRAQKDIFMLAEAWEPELLKDNLFDMGYGWDRHHAMNHIAKGEHKVAHWDETYSKDTARYENDDILMTFVTNHDENSWSGTIEERMGEAAEALTALSYVAPGMPLIYSGQEYGLKHRLKFFEKDSIPKAKGKEWDLLKKLGKLKNENVALHGGKNAASYTKIDTKNDHVLAFERAKEDKRVTYIANLSKEPQTIQNILKGTCTDYMKNSEVDFNKEEISLQPWEYLIIVE